VLERLKGMPFLVRNIFKFFFKINFQVNMVYAFQTDTKLHIVMGKLIYLNF